MPVGRFIGAFMGMLAVAGCAGNNAPTADGDRTPQPQSSSTTAVPVTTTAVAPPPSTFATITTTQAPGPRYQYASVPISGGILARVSGSSWRPGCPVPLDQLRYVTVSYWGFDGSMHTGELVVNTDAVDAVITAFHRLFDARFPIKSMRLVDDFGADDFTSIEADNTSAFNCRERSTGGGVWSQHAYGRAIDVNPIENPYVSHGSTSHPASQTYLDRSNHRAGMAFRGGDLVAAFASVGWGWGGNWSDPVDAQHFSASGS